MAVVVERAADDIRAEVQARGGELTIAASSRGSEGDDVLLRQAVSNLFRNALEACVDARITPRIVAEGTIDREQQTSCASRSPTTARASPPAVAERMFRPFFTTKARGTGPRPGAGPEDHRDPQRPRERGRAGEGGARLAVTLPLAD